MIKWFVTRDAEAGNVIDEFETAEEAREAIKGYEEEDKEEGNYTPDFYEVAVNHGFYDAAVALMDDDLRETLHAKLAPCMDAEFLEAYLAAHLDKYGVEFAI